MQPAFILLKNSGKKLYYLIEPTRRTLIWYIRQWMVRTGVFAEIEVEKGRGAGQLSDQASNRAPLALGGFSVIKRVYNNFFQLLLLESFYHAWGLRLKLYLRTQIRTLIWYIRQRMVMTGASMLNLICCSNQIAVYVLIVDYFLVLTKLKAKLFLVRQ